jgi:predicted enzyme related to lactoylglutathione lyase
MTQHYQAPIGAPCWIDLMTSDTARSAAFYGAILGWTAEDPNPDFGGYFNFQKDGLRIAGCMGSTPGAGQPDAWSIYLKTDDIDRTLQAAADNGGQVVVPAMPVGTLGSMAFVVDPGGSMIGTWQPGDGPDRHDGFGFFNVVGAPGWFELHTRSFAADIAFYEQVFGWDAHNVSDVDEFRYTTLGEGDDQKAGVMDATLFPADAPTGWSIYFRVADVDATLTQVVELGGTVVIQPEDTPYGRLAAAIDPTGAAFKLLG